jgi:hypothetical protein
MHVHTAVPELEACQSRVREGKGRGKGGVTQLGLAGGRCRISRKVPGSLQEVRRDGDL